MFYCGDFWNQLVPLLALPSAVSALTRGLHVTELRFVPSVALVKIGDGSDVEALAAWRVVFPASSTVAHTTSRSIQWQLVTLHNGTKISHEGLLSSPPSIVNSDYIGGVQEIKPILASSVMS